MSELIRNGQHVGKSTPILSLGPEETPDTAVIPEHPVLVPLSVWKAHQQSPAGLPSQVEGVWLSPKDDPGELLAVLNHVSVIALHFPAVNEGRPYSIAALLRARYDYTGELRAIGVVQRDYLHALRRVGFNAFEIENPEEALQGLHVFSEVYQASADQPLPLFRRKTA